MFTSNYGLITNRSNLIYATELYGSQVDIFYPVKMLSIRSDYDKMTFESVASFTGKVFLTSVFKQKNNNLSKSPFTPIDDDNSIYSTQEFPIGSLVVLRTGQSLQNYQIYNSVNFVDQDVIYYKKYVLVPYTSLNSTFNPTELLPETRQSDTQVTDISVEKSQIVSDLSDVLKLSKVDNETQRPRVIRPISPS